MLAVGLQEVGQGLWQQALKTHNSWSCGAHVIALGERRDAQQGKTKFREGGGGGDEVRLGGGWGERACTTTAALLDRTSHSKWL